MAVEVEDGPLDDHFAKINRSVVSCPLPYVHFHMNDY